ncbi:ATP-binding cassette subfamily B protein/subfamily B ATP-binding cassette protein MsbA [Limnobacter thiooxidans]|uniref:ABC transporter ATP-binding protein/permease n=1 Tax=Limnobacter thiooxidans TaxID=131080 RepID=A0AA86JH38_9BURK|nr:ATP-binding cassette subfamily B protein/subfamily B ATP-binding cassette protein MsbA [Limnobacter thiooxidans]BET26991.1 ABC transporter ATP-binding protein/permease [Limnobacter thiooxidans]
MKNLWRCIQFIPEYRGKLLGVIAVGTVLGVIGTATPYLYKAIVDVVARLLSSSISRDEATNSVLIILAVFLLLRVGVVVFGAIQNRQADDLWLDTVSTFRQRVFDNMTQKSIDYFEKTRVGEIMDRFGNITTITMWLSSLTDGVLASFFQMILIVGVLLWKAPVVGVIMAAVLVLNLWISYRTVGWTKPYRRGWQALAGRMTGLLAEMIGNIATVRSFGGEPAVKQRYDNTQEEWKVTRGKLHVTEWRSEQALNFINTFGVFTAVVYTTWIALQGALSAGDILLILTLSQMLITTVGPIARQINQAGEIESTAERLVELLDVESDIQDRPNARQLVQIDTIEFDQVSFWYPGKDSPALNKISFHLQAGQTAALVGLSGSGKTTIVKLLMRFYDPTQGRILINGIDLRDYQQRSVRALMGVVLQDVALFNDSIGENIAFARPGAQIADVRKAAKAAHAEDFINKLDHQYDTVVGERGIKLSGGEKQRVAIARAILKDPQLIILDEATSALDSESEELVQQGLDQLRTGRTSVVIAHRLSTVMNADQILVMQNGLIVEKGVHEDLLKEPAGLYARLFSLQTQGRHLSLARQA